MLKDVVAVEPLDGYKLRLWFEDGTEGTLDLAPFLNFRGVFAPLRDLNYFRQVRVDPGLGTVVWPKWSRSRSRCALFPAHWTPN